MDWLLGIFAFLGRLSRDQALQADAELGQAFEAFWPVIGPTFDTPQGKRFLAAAQACAVANMTPAPISIPTTPKKDDGGFHSDDPRYSNLNH